MKRWLEVAALSRIAELADANRRSTMTMPDQDERTFKAGVRSMWAMGDYGRFAELVWPVGPVIVEAAGVAPGMRVLDVATGTGNVAIRAAQAGAEVVASDLTPENFEAGRRNARTAGVDLEWVEADAEALPFDDDSFDVVTSAFGAMFAPRHQRVADELTRVCKPGGTIAMANFPPEGTAADFFAVFIPHMPPPRDGDLPPLLWGDPGHVRALLGDRVSSLEMAPKTYVERASSPRAYCDFVVETFGPVAAIYQALADQPEKRAALDRAFLDFATRASTGPANGPAEYLYEYLLVVARA
jgi:2-polyprenyl-3-methyl-5-hydroxy-6-metoxy-1,4-benzoquinol methylase